MRKRVLVVEDNIDLAWSYKTLLDLCGHDPAIAYTADSALQQLSPPPDVVVLDLGLPDMDGCLLAQLIRTRLGARPVLIVVTASSDKTARSKAEAAGVDHYFTKPIDPRKWMDLIRQDLARAGGGSSMPPTSGRSVESNSGSTD